MFFEVLSGQRSQIADGTFANLSIRSYISCQGCGILTDNAKQEKIQTRHPFGVDRPACVSAATNLSPLRGSSALKSLKHRVSSEAGGIHAYMNAEHSSSVLPLNRHLGDFLS
jgi:hypothetical protein